MLTPVFGLARLRSAAVSGGLDLVCARHRVRVMTVFGSAARGIPGARDLDVGVLIEPGHVLDQLALVSDLVELSGVDSLDLAHLNRAGPVLRERALVGVLALFESEQGAFADAQTAAIGERIETDPMRRLSLQLLGR